MCDARLTVFDRTCPKCRVPLDVQKTHQVPDETTSTSAHGFARFVLTVAQFLCILGCIGAVGGMIEVFVIAEGLVWVYLVAPIGAFLAFSFWAALFIVFGRTKGPRD